MDLVFDNVIIDIFPLGVVLLTIVLFRIWRRKRNMSYMFCFLIFGAYLLFATKETLFPIPISGDYADGVRTHVTFLSQVNLIPFHFGNSLNTKRILVTNLQNILLTIPFGFGVNFIADLRAKDFRWIALAVSLGIEAAQLAISLGVGTPYRVIDINDVIFNAIGVLAGYACFRAFSWVYLAITKKYKIEHKGLYAYISTVVSQKHLHNPDSTPSNQ